MLGGQHYASCNRDLTAVAGTPGIAVLSILSDAVNLKIKIKTGKQAFSHPFSRLSPIEQWEGDPDSILTLIRSIRIGRTAISPPTRV